MFRRPLTRATEAGGSARGRQPFFARGRGEASVPAAHKRNTGALVLAVMDGLSLISAFFIAVYVWLPWDHAFLQSALVHLPYFVIFSVVWYVVALDQRLFTEWTGDRLSTYGFVVIKAVGTALVVSTVATGLFTREGFDRDFALDFCVSVPVIILGSRLIARILFFFLCRLGFFVRKVLIVGANPWTVRLVEVIRSRANQGYRIEGFLEDDPQRIPVLEKLGVPLLGTIDDLGKLLDVGTIEEVYLSLPMRSRYETIQKVSNQCERVRVSLKFIVDLFPMQIAKSRLLFLNDIPMLSLSAIPETRLMLAAKRLLDFTISSVLLVMLSPAFLFFAILIKLGSPGPVFFGQQRVGQNQRAFRMLKFRSMVANAEDLREEMAALNEADGPVFKIKDDPRITPLGKFIRKYSIDEFPQLINVWLGEMSLVGPRPPLASEVEEYTWSQRRRLSVRPGMTGLWQVSGRSNIDFETWVELDLLYIDTWTIVSDFQILFKTFRAVVEGRGAA